jgi:AcrR family transcriptional regulator
MPSIFDDETRNRIRIKLLENGFERIKTFGLSKSAIEDIAKSAGIAKGTFYSFFKSKDEFVIALIQFKRTKMKQEFEKLIAAKGYLDKADVRRYLEHLVYGDNNVFTYLSAAELAALSARNGIETTPSEQDVQRTTMMILNYIPDKNPNCNWRLVANYMRVVAITWNNRNHLLEGAIPETINGLISLIIDTIFRKDEDDERIND